MIHAKIDDFSALVLAGNDVFISGFISDACDTDDQEFLHDLCLDYLNNETYEVGVEINIKLSDLLNATIENHELINEPDEVILDAASKPIFDATKAELLKLIARIDSLKFKSVD